MANGTRLHQLAESVEECKDAITQQHFHNSTVQNQLTEVTDMLRTLLTNPPTPEQPAFVVSLDDRRQNVLDRCNEWDDCDGRQTLKDDADLDFLHDDRRVQAPTLRLDFPHFDGDNYHALVFRDIRGTRT
jgi:hypothetical protein